MEETGCHCCDDRCTNHSPSGWTGSRTKEEGSKQVRHILLNFLRHGGTNALHSSTPTTTTSDTSPSPVDSNSSTATQTANAPTSSPTSTLTPSAAPANFPVGSYSLVTFLDTVTTGCTSDPNTWTCAPFTDYYTDPQKALTVLNWEITGSSGSYKISSKGQDGTFDTTFQNEKLELLDEGKDQERFRFQINRSKTVNMTGSLGEETGDFECDFGSTGLAGYLYTKMSRTYPDDTIAVSGVTGDAWPYGMFHSSNSSCIWRS